MSTEFTPTVEQIETLRDLFFKKLENENPSCDGSFHPKDIERIKSSNRWLQLFLEQVDLDMKLALKILWETCVWRKTFGTNEMNTDNIRMDYMDSGAMFIRNKDINGKYLLILKSKLHQKGTKDVNELIRLLVYWIERAQRETNYDQLTLFFDMAGAGLSNMDMDFTKRIIDTFKSYYPNSLNYIVIYDMPWILNAAFKIIKGLLPPKAVAKMKFLNCKTIKDIVDENNSLKSWGGLDTYEFKFEPEQTNMNGKSQPLEPQVSVHFANPSPPDSPMSSELSAMTANYTADKDGEMLRMKPEDSIIFTKTDNEYAGTVDITNISKETVTYKIKTTSPDKFRVKPSSGLLAPGATTTINVVLQQGQQISLMSKDKFLVMCMAIPNDFNYNPQAIAEFWKKAPSTSDQIEQHRLKCTLPNSATGDGFKNGRVNTISFDTNDNKLINTNLNTTLCQLSEQNCKLESQLKFLQKLQIFTLIFFLLISFLMLYIVKQELTGQLFDCPASIKNTEKGEL